MQLGRILALHALDPDLELQRTDGGQVLPLSRLALGPLPQRRRKMTGKAVKQERLGAGVGNAGMLCHGDFAGNLRCAPPHREAWRTHRARSASASSSRIASIAARWLAAARILRAQASRAR